MIIDKKATLNVITDLSPKALVRDSVEIILNIYGNDYLHTILPNGFVSVSTLLVLEKAWIKS